MLIRSFRLTPYRLALTEPFRWRRGEVGSRDGVLLRLEGEGGAVGWGDCAPLPGFSREALAPATDAIRAAAAALVGRTFGPGEVADPDGPLHAELDALKLPSSSRFALDLALLDLAAQATSRPMPALLHPDPAPTLPLAALVTAPGWTGVDEAARLVSEGYRTLKLKASSARDTAAMLLAVRERVGPDVALRLDANRAWSYEIVAHVARAIRRARVAFVEEPIRESGRLHELVQERRIPVAVDESVQETGAAAIEPWAAAVVLKPTLVGGLAAALSLARRAREMGVPVVVSAAYESGVGMRGLVALAAATGGEAAGLDTYRRLRSDVLAERLPLERPLVDVPSFFAAPREVRALPLLAESLGEEPGRSGRVDVWRSSVPCPVRVRSYGTPGGAALVSGGQSWTWRAWAPRVTGAADRMRALGPEGTRVAVLADTSPDYVAVVQGALRAGVVLCPLSTRLPDAAVADALDRLGGRILLTDRPSLAPPGVRVLDLAEVGDRPDPRGAGGIGDLIAPDRPALALFTSGTTGAPKPALFTAGQLLASARGVVGWADLRTGDRWLLDLPLYHVGGLGVVLRCAVVGAALVLPERGATTAEALAAYRPTHVSLVATQLHRLLRDGRPGDAPPDGLRVILLGGGAIPPDLLDEAKARNLPVATSYGLTEMASTVAMTAPGAPRGNLATSGRPLRHARVEVRDGEIFVGGPSRFLGYLDGGRLVEPFDADGLFATGDLGHFDAEGRLVVTGRRDHLFVSGGENVQPEEVEAALAALPGVVRAVVVPRPDAEFGHRPVAFVETASGVPPDGVALARALARALPRFKVPAAFLPWPADLPEGMKPDRRDLMARAKGALRDLGPPGV